MNRLARALLVAAPVLALGALGGFAGAARVRRSLAGERSVVAAPAGLLLHVPHAAGPIVLDGDMDDPGWRSATARTGAFVDAGGDPVHPYSDARLVWGDGHLYVALYAADEDIRATQPDADAPLWREDAFQLLFADGAAERSIDVSPLGTVTDARRAGSAPFDYAWQSGVHVSREIDGTLNRPDDDDEEWVIEMAIPFESLGLRGERGESTGFRVRRCDTPHDGRRICASWGWGREAGALVLD